MNKNKHKFNGSGTGLLGGILWGFDTVLVGVVLGTTVLNTPQAIAIAPLVSTFLHDFFSSIWMLIFTALNHGFGELKKALKTKSGKFVMVAALFGGPIGMTGYMLAINYIGASYTAVISAMYPAVGALLSMIFLKEKMGKLGALGLTMAITATMILGFTTTDTPKNIWLGILFALLCVFGWGIEVVICAYGMKNDVLPETALQIRQLTSAIVYGLLIMPIIKGYPLAAQVASSPVILLIALTALAGTSSYLCYYRSIDGIGPIKAMGLNISYSAWAIFIGIFFGNGISLKALFLALIIITGSLLTTENPGEFLQLFHIGEKTEKKVNI